MSDIRFASNPNDVKKYDSDQLRSNYLLERVMIPDTVTSVYSMHDRMITLGIVPVKEKLKLPAMEDLTKSDFFLARRELGVINVGEEGVVTVDGETFNLKYQECLFIGKGKRDIIFESKSSGTPAEFYINSCPAHKEYPTTHAALTAANKVELGSKENSNERTIYQYIHEDGIQSCQLVMGFTALHTGSIWNTFPPHTHLRRMEMYFYFDLPEKDIVMHFMGDPSETRHIVMRNKQAVISPEWSIHAGAGTSSYSFIWGMAGENKAFTDMDGADVAKIK